MTYAQYLRQLLAPLGIYQLNAPFQGGELEALGDAFDQVEGALEELNREACLATAEDWGLEQVAVLFRRRPPATTVKTMREALAALLRIGGDSFTLAAINDTISGCGVNARVERQTRRGPWRSPSPRCRASRPTLRRSGSSSRTSFPPT